MQFSEVSGTVSIDVNHFKAFAYAWFRPEDLVSIVAFPLTPLGKRKTISQLIPVKDLVEASNEDFEALCYIGEDKLKCNTYMSVFPIKEGTAFTLGSRGTEKDVKAVYGAFIDLDVESPDKQGCFHSKQEIFDFLNGLEHPPTIVVENGKSGGIHAYWRLNDGEVADKQLLERWWAYISSKTDRKIDKLIDIIRLSRLPSGIYWAKRDGDITDTVKVLSNSGPRYSLEEMTTASEDAFFAYKARVRKIIDKDSQRAWGNLPAMAAEIWKAHTGDGYSWPALRILAFIEEIYNEKVDWSDILVEHGWTFLRDLENGEREWARPGRDERSATTDYVHDDGELSPVMSLLSMAEETGLSDLKEAGIPLTKYRVSLRLDFGDNEQAFMEHIKNNILGL